MNHESVKPTDLYSFYPHSNIHFGIDKVQQFLRLDYYQ